MDGLLAALALNILAEFGDKTQLAVFALSARYRKPAAVFAGAFTGEVLATGLGILLGAYAMKVLPLPLLKFGGGLAFVVLGAWFLLRKDSAVAATHTRASHASAFVATMGMIFLAEMGDKSQAANALLATRYDPWSVFLGSAIALGLLIAAATLIGHKFANSKFAPLVRVAAGLLFVALGVATVLL